MPCRRPWRAHGRVAFPLLLLCIAVSWHLRLPLIVGRERLAASIAEDIEREIAKAASPHSDVDVDDGILRYSNEMHLLQRMPEHLFGVASVLCRAACSRACVASRQASLRHSTSKLTSCRCPNPFDEILNLSRTDPDQRWQELSDLDIAKRGKALDLCSGIQACLSHKSNARPACAARSERIFQGEFGGEAQEHADGMNQRVRRPENLSEPDAGAAMPLVFQPSRWQKQQTPHQAAQADLDKSRLRAQLVRAGPAAVRQLFEYISSITFGEHNVGIIEQILDAALPEDTSFQGDFVDLGCGRGKMIAGD